MNHISAARGAAYLPDENLTGRIARASRENEQAASRRQENAADISARGQDRDAKAEGKNESAAAPENGAPLKDKKQTKRRGGAVSNAKAISKYPVLPFFPQYEPSAKQSGPLDLYGARTKESAMLKTIRADAVARKIAGGKYVSIEDREFLEKTDPLKAQKAKFANQQRIMTETNIAGVKNKAVIKQILQNAKNAAAADADIDAGALVNEGIADLEERYLRKERSHSGRQSALAAANYTANLMKTPTSRFNLLA